MQQSGYAYFARQKPVELKNESMDSNGTHKHTPPSNDALFATVSAEDNLWLFWQSNKKTIYACIMAIIIGIGAFQVWQNHKRNALIAMQTAFLAASTTDSWDSFVADYDSIPLGSIAALHAADEAWISGDFQKAQRLYNDSAKGLAHIPLSIRATLGEALCIDVLGKRDEAISKLNALVENTSALETYRAQAAYQLALIALEAGDVAQTKRYLDRVSALPMAGLWAQKATLLIDTTPSLHEETKAS